ncbi:MAG: rod shape-determining protein MreC [Litorivicinus sp.]
MFAAVLSGLLLTGDSLLEPVQAARGYVSSLFSPVQQLASKPVAWFFETAQETTELAELKARLKALELENERLLVRQHRMRALESENDDLRESLAAARRLDDEFLHATVLAHSADPFIQRLVVNRGYNAGSALGQAVVDRNGLVGQVVEVGGISSHVLLVTDASHQVPVVVERSGYKAIARGTGHPDQLELINVPPTAEIAVGDLLQTSGLGQRFPEGYPVARVVSIKRTPGQAFAQILAAPVAQTDRLDRVMLVYRTQTARDRALAILEVAPGDS